MKQFVREEKIVGKSSINFIDIATWKQSNEKKTNNNNNNSAAKFKVANSSKTRRKSCCSVFLRLFHLTNFTLVL